MDGPRIGKRCSIHPTAVIRAASVVIGDDCTIGEGCVIEVAGSFRLGRCSIIGPRNTVKAMACDIGEYCYTREDVEFGGGGCYSSRGSAITIGHSFFSGENTVVNCARSVVIGDEVGLGASVGIWTHGAYLPSHVGFPASFAPVKIGSRVWIPGAANVLPGVTIGDNVVIGMGSLVNRDLPSGCLAGGLPVKVLREDIYPARLTPETVGRLTDEYNERLDWLGIDSRAQQIGFAIMLDGSVFGLGGLGVGTVLSPVAEDFRNWLRQRGIRFRTGKPYQSLQHPEVDRWLS